MHAGVFSSRDGGYNPKWRIAGKHGDMLKNSVDKVTIEIVCVTCGTGQSKPIGYFRNHSQLTCDGCGSEITVENRHLRVSTAEFDRTRYGASERPLPTLKIALHDGRPDTSRRENWPTSA
jgi:hypothetical protein